MALKEIYSDFKTSFDQFNDGLNHYSEEDLKKKKDDDVWSLGQMYNHLLNGTRNFHFRMIEKCLSDNENSDDQKSAAGERSFRENLFSAGEVKVPPSPQYTPTQPPSIAEVKQRLTQLDADMKTWMPKIESSANKGKMKHFAFGYLSAAEWYKLIAMHFRHHLRQKEKLEKQLNERLAE
jgi:DinB superfamily